MHDVWDEDNQTIFKSSSCLAIAMHQASAHWRFAHKDEMHDEGGEGGYALLMETELQRAYIEATQS
jgi:hypothetical protein